MTGPGSEPQAAYYPIRIVAAETGVNAITLRAWERRYGLIVPKRTAKGHRLYTDQDIRMIKQVVTLLDRGIPISQAQAMLANGDSPDASLEALKSDTPSQWQHYREQLQSAIHTFDDGALGRVFEEVSQFFPVDVAIRFLFVPFYQHLATKVTMPLGMARLNFYTSFLQARLAWRVSNHNAQANERKILIVNGTQDSEIQLLLIAILLQQLGLSVTRMSGVLSPADVVRMVNEYAKWPALVFQVEDAPSENRMQQLQSVSAETGKPVFITGHHTNFDVQLRQLGLIPLSGDPQKAALTIRDIVQEIQ